MNKYHRLYMQQALQIAMFSYAPDRKVGCVITKGNRSISNGYNGTKPGLSNKMVNAKGKTLDKVIHAEANAILACIKEQISLGPNTTCYVTLAPCIDCARLIVSQGISKVIYYEDWPKSNEGIEFLVEQGVEVHKWEMKDDF